MGTSSVIQHHQDKLFHSWWNHCCPHICHQHLCFFLSHLLPHPMWEGQDFSNHDKTVPFLLKYMKAFSIILMSSWSQSAAWAGSAQKSSTSIPIPSFLEFPRTLGNLVLLGFWPSTLITFPYLWYRYRPSPAPSNSWRASLNSVVWSSVKSHTLATQLCGTCSGSNDQL